MPTIYMLTSSYILLMLSYILLTTADVSNIYEAAPAAGLGASPPNPPANEGNSRRYIFSRYIVVVTHSRYKSPLVAISPFFVYKRPTLDPSQGHPFSQPHTQAVQPAWQGDSFGSYHHSVAKERMCLMHRYIVRRKNCRFCRLLSRNI